MARELTDAEIEAIHLSIVAAVRDIQNGSPKLLGILSARIKAERAPVEENKQ